VPPEGVKSAAEYAQIRRERKERIERRAQREQRGPAAVKGKTDAKKSARAGRTADNKNGGRSKAKHPR